MGKLDEIKKIRTVSELKKFVQENKEWLQKIMLPVVVGCAIILFWIFGSGSDDTEPIVINEGEVQVEEQVEAELEQNVSASIFVDIGGEVNSPGVYQVEEGTRLFQLVDEAGGLKDTADTDSINQAEIVSDGQKIIIGSKDPDSIYYTGINDDGKSSGLYTGQSAVIESENGFIVNINIAESDDLQLIPGVGPSTAQKIIDYREQQGKFKSKEDIKNVSGIGEKTYENMKDYITV